MFKTIPINGLAGPAGVWPATFSGTNKTPPWEQKWITLDYRKPNLQWFASNVAVFACKNFFATYAQHDFHCNFRIQILWLLAADLSSEKCSFTILFWSNYFKQINAKVLWNMRKYALIFLFFVKVIAAIIPV